MDEAKKFFQENGFTPSQAKVMAKHFHEQKKAAEAQYVKENTPDEIAVDQMIGYLERGGSPANISKEGRALLTKHLEEELQRRGVSVCTLKKLKAAVAKQ